MTSVDDYLGKDNNAMNVLFTYFSLLGSFLSFLFFIFGGHKSFFLTALFVGPLVPLFWTSDDICSGFQSQNGHPYSSFVQT